MTTTTTAAQKPATTVNLKDMSPNDVFSEISHYQYLGYDKTKGYSFRQLETGQTVYLTEVYVQNLLSTADQYNQEVVVGREDKLWTAKQIADATKKGEVLPSSVREGDVRLKGIRSLFEEIYNSEVMTVCFRKQDKPLSAKRLAELRSTQIADAVKEIESAKASKKSMATAYSAALQRIQENPVLPYEAGEERVLRGYKIQFTSRDGRYDCVDMDIDTSKGETNVRPVNINTILWLVYKGTKYTVEA